MRITNKIAQAGLLILGISLGITACQKMSRPALGNYPKDSNPPGGPLKFYASMNGGNVDSIRAVFGTDVGVTYVDGVSGKAMQATPEVISFIPPQMTGKTLPASPSLSGLTRQDPIQLAQARLSPSA